VCGAIFNAVTYTTKPQNQSVEIVTFKSLRNQEREEIIKQQEQAGVIRAPKKKMPDDLQRELHEVSLSAIKII
jgi:hypothetical protein